MKTPRTITVVLEAGESKDVPVIGQFVHIRSCTVATIQAAFDNDPLQVFYPGGTYPASEPFSKIRFYDHLGGGCTLIIIVADTTFTGDFDSMLLTAIDATLTGMATNIADVENLLEVADTPTAIGEQDTLSAGTTHLVTKSANIRKIEIQADYDNTAAIYVGFTTGVTSANAAIHLQPGQSMPFDGNIDLWVGAANDTDKVRGYYVATS